MPFDLPILDFLQEHLKNAFLDFVMPFITFLGDGGAIWILLTLILIGLSKTRRAGTIMAVSLLIEVLLCNVVLKTLVARIRPYDVNTAVQLLIKPPSDFSFPSGHTGASFASASALYFGKSLIWIPAVILSVLIAFSRLYLYVHYPTDVLAGAVLGILAGWLGSLLVAYIQRKIDEKKQKP